MDTVVLFEMLQVMCVLIICMMCNVFMVFSILSFLSPNIVVYYYVLYFSSIVHAIATLNADMYFLYYFIDYSTIFTMLLILCVLKMFFTIGAYISIKLLQNYYFTIKRDIVHVS